MLLVRVLDGYKKVRVDASAKLNDLGGKVCFDIERLLRYEYADNADMRGKLVALLGHEYAHHIGLKDSGHNILSFLVSYFDEFYKRKRRD